MPEFSEDSASFNPSVLVTLRRQYASSQSQIAKAVGVPAAQIAKYEAGEAIPSQLAIKRIARYFRVTEHTLYRKTLPRQTKTIDFRQNLRDFRGEPGPIIDAINQASQIQRLISQVVDYSETWKSHGYDRISTNQDPEDVAAIWRLNLDISDDVQVSNYTDSQFFSYVRSRIEALGISVIVSSIEERQVKGLTLGTNEAVPVIVVNSFMQRRPSRTFTLAHEFGHVLIGSDDVSNPYAPDGAVEKFCNKFAGALLIPRALLTNLIRRRKSIPTANSSIRWLASKLKVSMEAVVIRLHECGIAPATFWAEWKSQFSSNGRLPSEEDEGGGGGASQGVVKLARLGFLFGRTVPVRYRERGLTSMAVFQGSRLKPKYFLDLYEATSDRLKEVESYGAA